MEISSPAHAETDPVPAGPVRYVLYILDRNDNGEPTGESIRFRVSGLALPRPGDKLHFDAGGAPLNLTVRDVEHWFFTADEGPEFREISVFADADESERLTVRRLSNREERRRWIERFGMLDDLD